MEKSLLTTRREHAAAMAGLLFLPLACALTSGDAKGQSAGTYKEIADSAKAVPKLTPMTVSQLKGMNILFTTSKVADVGGVLGDATGTPVALIALYGGFWGFGQSAVVLPLENVSLKAGFLETTLHPDQLSKLPPWK